MSYLPCLSIDFIRDSHETPSLPTGCDRRHFWLVEGRAPGGVSLGLPADGERKDGDFFGAHQAVADEVPRFVHIDSGAS
ncbi:hypothetical protein CCP4SC76_310001 [Gammaproteobacteria bacterium]